MVPQVVQVLMVQLIPLWLKMYHSHFLLFLLIMVVQMWKLTLLSVPLFTFLTLPQMALLVMI